MLTKSKKIYSDVWTYDSFGLNKAKFLLPFKAKWLITSLDNEEIYGVANIIPENKKLINDRNEEIVNVLTDKNLIIQNFSPNALKILNLNMNSIINNDNISYFITELNQNLINEFESRNEKEESNISTLRKNNNNSRRTTRYIKSDILGSDHCPIALEIEI